jgi:hypothetical protein
MTIVTSLWALFLRQEERNPDAWGRLRLLAETSGLAVDASLAASGHVSRCIAASGALHSPAGWRAAILGRPLT